MRRKQCPRRPAQVFPEKCVRNGLGCRMSESFLTAETGHQRESLVERISREAWQEKGELNWMGIRENTCDQE